MFRRRPILFPRRIWRRRMLRSGCLFWMLPLLTIVIFLAGRF